MRFNVINNAKQIWIKGENSFNTWMCFRKEFYYYRDSRQETGKRKILAEIAVDSKYWLYLNGRLVIREGGLKRGPSKNGTYYDELDLSEYLADGKNVLAVLVWYFGKSGFSHLSSGMGGLRCAIGLPDETLYSDSSWKIIKHSAFAEAEVGDEPINFRLAEPDIYYDAAKDLGAWYAVDYDSSSWQYADEIPGREAERAWGRLEKRITPQLKDFGVKPYVNSDEFVNRTYEENTVLAMRLPYNAQFTPLLKVTAPGGLKIRIHTDNYKVGVTGERCAMTVYYTKEGYQAYEAFGWLSGERAYYHIPAGVTVHSLEYRETGYDTEFVGKFECDDEFLNKLWTKSLTTSLGGQHNQKNIENI